MDWPPISKSPANLPVQPNLVDYDKARAGFSWEAIRKELGGLPNGGLNAHEAVDRHAAVAITSHRWLGADGATRDFTYRDLAEAAAGSQMCCRSSAQKRGSGVRARGPDSRICISALGTLKNTSVFCPLFSAFGPEPIFQRLHRGDAKVLVTTAQLYKKKVAGLRERLPQLQRVLLADADDDLSADVLSLPKRMAAASSEFTIPPTDPEEMALLHFTSGTTGMPKGAIHVHGAVLTHYATGKFVLDLHPTDIFWCTADPGWVTGTSYGIFAPLIHGVTNIVDEADFDAERYRILEAQQVTVWYGANGDSAADAAAD